MITNESTRTKNSETDNSNRITDQHYQNNIDHYTKLVKLLHKELMEANEQIRIISTIRI